MGVIDSLRVKDGLVSLYETKTRRTASLPPDAQVQNAKLQVCVCFCPFLTTLNACV